jgi:hypothetical protein
MINNKRRTLSSLKEAGNAANAKIIILKVEKNAIDAEKQKPRMTRTVNQFICLCQLLKKLHLKHRNNKAAPVNNKK